MATVSPLPGLVSAQKPHAVTSRLRGALGRFIRTPVALEPSDPAARITFTAAAVVLPFLLGETLFGPGFLRFLPYQLLRMLMYGAGLSYGCMMAAGFMSNSRTARFAAGAAATAMAAYAIVSRGDLPNQAFQYIRLAYGVVLVGTLGLAAARGLYRWLRASRT